MPAVEGALAVEGAAVPLDPPPAVAAVPGAGAVLVDADPPELVPEPVSVLLAAPPLQAANTTAVAANRAR